MNIPELLERWPKMTLIERQNTMSREDIREAMPLLLELVAVNKRFVREQAMELSEGDAICQTEIYSVLKRMGVL